MNEYPPILVDSLVKAWANEWISFFYYLFLTGVTRFKGFSSIAEELNYVTNEELNHAEFLEDVLSQLAIIPKRDWSWIEKTARCSKLYYPESMQLTKKIFRAIEATENCVFEIYEQIMIMTYDNARNLFHSIQMIIASEENHRLLLVKLRKTLL